MIEDYYKSIKNLSCDVLSTIKPTLKISTTDAQSCHVFSQHEFTADTTLLCVKGLNGRPKYSLWSLDVDEIDLVRYLILNLQSCFVQKYEFQSMFYFDHKYPVYNREYTNPSYLAGLPSGTMTMSIAGGHTNQHTNLSYFVGTVNTISASDYKPAEQSCTEEFSNLSYHEDIANASDQHSISKLLYPLYHASDQHSIGKLLYPLISKLLYPLYQRGTYLSGIYSCNLRIDYCKYTIYSTFSNTNLYPVSP